jgi:hypothetical protein
MCLKSLQQLHKAAFEITGSHGDPKKTPCKIPCGRGMTPVGGLRMFHTLESGGSRAPQALGYWIPLLARGMTWRVGGGTFDFHFTGS